MVKTTVTTSFGDLTLPVKSDDQRILAEVKGLTLLQTIVEQSKIWASIYSHERGEFEIFSLDDGEELSIFPLETIRKFHIHDNPHLEVTLDDEPVCILMEQGQQCAAVDAVISLVLLGEAGWPLQQTPFQLRHKAKHLAEFRIRTGRRFSSNDYEDILRIEEFLNAERYADALAAVGAFSRRCYACKGWDIAEIRVAIEPMLEEIYRVDRRMIHDYLRAPIETADRIFIPRKYRVRG